MNAGMNKGEWLLRHADGSEKIKVSFDLNRGRLANYVHIEMGTGGDQWFYVDVADVPWFCARLMLAAEHIAGGEQSQ